MTPSSPRANVSGERREPLDGSAVDEERSGGVGDESLEVRHVVGLEVSDEGVAAVDRVGSGRDGDDAAARGEDEYSLGAESSGELVSEPGAGVGGVEVDRVVGGKIVDANPEGFVEVQRLGVSPDASSRE